MKQYTTSDAVPNTGEYVCASCGEMTEFEKGDDFSVCGSCGDENTAGWIPALEEGEGNPDPGDTLAAENQEDEDALA